MKIIIGDTHDNIAYYENILNDELCEKIINWGKDKEDILTTGVALDEEIVKEIYPALHEIITDLIKNYVKDFDVNSFPDDFGIEPFHIKGLCYDEVTEQYQIDVGSHDMARRFLGLFFVLNESKEPGEIKFYRQGVSLKPKKGSVFIYPSLWTHPQLRHMPKVDTEYTLGTYLHYL